MNTVEKNSSYSNNKNIGEVKMTASKIIGYEQLDWKNILQFSKYDKKESIAEKILRNRRNNI